MNQLMQFQYEGQQVRTHKDEQGNPWFVARDVCEILGLSNVSKALKGIREFEKGITTGNTLGGKQELLIVSEPGLYKLIFKSRKPFAEKFQDWVTSEVLPSIRKTGSYSVISHKGDKITDELTVLHRTLEQMIETRKEQLKLEANFHQLESKVNTAIGELNAHVAHINPSWFTVRGFGSLQKLNLNEIDASRLGRKAATLCRSKGIVAQQIADSRWGKVGIYPQEILEEIFSGFRPGMEN